MATFDEFFATLDIDEEGTKKTDKSKKGVPFEGFVKWFLENDPIWSSKVEKVWFNEEQDLGVDLIFLDKDGKKWAVQSKCYSPTTSITKKSIDSFISASPNSKYYGRLLIASTDLIGSNAEIILDENNVVRYLLNDFQNSSIDFPKSLEHLSKSKRKDPHTPFPHQKNVIDDVVEGFKYSDRGQVLMACGTGKTLTSLFIKEKLKANDVLVLVPSLNLLSQTLKEWNNNKTYPFNWICVCSDKSTAKKNLDNDHWINNPSELGIPVTSSIEDIQRFLREKESKVIFSTYQSSFLVSEAQKHLNFHSFDIVFFDEAHRCAGKVSEDFNCALNAKKINSKKRLFFTATPKVISNRVKGFANANDIEITSMDDQSMFGNIFHELKFSDAIKNKPPLLTDYQVLIIGVDNKMIHEKIKDRDLLETRNGELIDSETIALQIALAKAIKNYNLKRIINFHSRIEGAKIFADTFEKIIYEMSPLDRPSGEISCDYVEGKMSTSTRNKKIRSLENLNEGERKILGNAKCLSEGVDVPAIDGICFIDPKSSQIDIIQAVGRAIRKSEGKKIGTIIIPIYLHDLENIEDEILVSRFADVWQIINALKFQDDSLRVTIDNLKVSLGKRKIKSIHSDELSKIKFELPSDRINQKFISSIQTILVENTSENWYLKYGQLITYQEKHGDTLVHRNEPNIGRWVEIQRVLYKEKKIAKEKIDLLDQIGFVWDASDRTWNKRIDEFKEVRKIYGGTQNIPSFGRGSKYYQLYKWFGTVRKRFKDKKLTEEKIKQLKDLDFVFDNKRKKDEEWLKVYKQYLDFKRKNKKEPTASEDKILREWRNTQIKRKKSKEGIIKWRLDLLEEANFTWSKEDIWLKKLKKTEKYIEKFGNLENAKQKSKQVSDWIKYQKFAYKNEKLSKEKINLLNKLDSDWNKF